MKDTYILAIESSCDETAASIVKNAKEIVSNGCCCFITARCT